MIGYMNKYTVNSETDIYRRNRRFYFVLLLSGIILDVLIFGASLCIGNYKTTFADVISVLINQQANVQVYKIVVHSRLPRLISAVFVGAALSIAGLTYQDIFSNRMASPDILGVSAGAGVGASISIYYGISFWLTGLFSFIGGVAAVCLTIATSKLFAKMNYDSVSLILAGIVIGGLMNSFLGFFKYLSNDSQLASITFWLLGGFYNTQYRQLTVACPIITIGIVILFLLRWKIVMLRSGDSDAYTHGINAAIIRNLCITVTTIITSISICISGTIGWIGLAIPNLMRLLIKNDGRRLMPLSIVYGILLTEICDLLARTITNTEIPVGIISGFIGAAMFIFVLIVQKRGRQDD